MRVIQILTAAIALSGICWAIDEKQNAEFWQKLQKEYLDEYAACTGDTGAVDNEKLLAWRQEMSRFTQAPDYQRVLKEFEKTTGIPARMVRTCDVIAWKAKNDQAAIEKEAARVRDSLAREVVVAESVGLARELRDHPASKFDFGPVRFGLSREAFVKLFKQSYPSVPIDDGRFIQARGVVIDGAPFSASFHFDQKGTYYKYEIASAPCVADSLDIAVRPMTQHLVQGFAAKVGEPSKRYRIARFDPHPDKLSPCAQWRDSSGMAAVGVMMKDYRYSALQVVIDTTVSRKGGDECKSLIARDEFR